MTTPSRRATRAGSRLAVVLALAFGALCAAAPPSAAATPITLEQWCTRYLAYLGSPATGPSDQRVRFLERWAGLEGSFALGNRHNPLDTELDARGAQLWNVEGVRRYRTVDQGFRATLSTMEQGFDKPILVALRSRRSTFARLALALAESNWTGYGSRSWIEQGYASRVSGLPIRSFDLLEPTVSIAGRLVDPLGRPLGDVCVSALSRSAAPVGRVTGPDGTFQMTGLARAAYRLQVVDCRHDAHEATPVYYDAGAAPTYTTRTLSRATLLSSSCSEESPCPDQHVELRHPVHFGTITPAITWPIPRPIAYGVALSRTQLDARSSLPGTFTYTPGPGTVLGPGTRTIRVTFRPRKTPGIEVTISRISILVKRAMPSVSWPAPAPIASGSALSPSQLDATSPVPGTFTYSPASGAVLGPGSQHLRVTFRPKDARDFAVAIARVSIAVRGAVQPVP